MTPPPTPIAETHSLAQDQATGGGVFGEIRSVIIKVQHNCMSDRKRYGKLEDVPIRHEYCVVFKKVESEKWVHRGVLFDGRTKKMWCCVW